jgi:hypothetical protein
LTTQLQNCLSRNIRTGFIFVFSWGAKRTVNQVKGFLLGLMFWAIHTQKFL